MPSIRHEAPLELLRRDPQLAAAAVLLVICPRAGTAARCRAPIRTGHPGFDLEPLVVDAATIPDSGGPGLREHPELVVLAVLTGALDLDQDSSRRLVLTRLAGLDEGRLKTYTVFVLNAASEAARQALEAMMSTAPFKNDFVDRLLAEGKAEGKAESILSILAVRGLEVSDEIRERVLSCADISQLEAWGRRAVTEDTVDEVFDG